MRFIYWIIIICLFSCVEHKNPDYSNIIVRVENYWNDSLLTKERYNIFNYTSCNNDTCSVSKTEFIVSKFIFYKNGKISYADSTKTIYCNSGEIQFNLEKVPCGLYDSMSFNIGENFPKNFSDININNMAWPEPMGGGYHFIKYEGYFLKNGTPDGYALHAGGKHLSPLKITYKKNILIQYSSHYLTINQYIDKWISGSNYCINLKLHNYTMGDDSMMNVLLKNGKDAFKISFK